MHIPVLAIMLKETERKEDKFYKTNQEHLFPPLPEA